MNVKIGSGDRRAQRTRQSLRNSLIQLILEKHYDTISVQDIINRANVGRSTFYLHFRDKGDLFRGDWQNVITHFVEQITADRLSEGRVFPIKELFGHLKDFHHLYRALIKSGKTDWLYSFGQKYLAEQIEYRLNHILQPETHTTIPVSILANYLASEVFSQLKWWLDNDMPNPPEKMEEIFHQLVLPGFSFGIRSSTNSL